METSPYIMEAIHIVWIVISGLVSLVTWIVIRRFGKLEEEDKVLRKKIEEDIRMVLDKHERFERESRMTHKDIYELTKAVQLQLAELTTLVKTISSRICKND